MTTVELAITGMHCASCSVLICDAVEQLPGVVSVETDVRTARTVVQLDGTGAGAGQVIDAIAAEGYGATLVAGEAS